MSFVPIHHHPYLYTTMSNGTTKFRRPGTSSGGSRGAGGTTYSYSSSTSTSYLAATGATSGSSSSSTIASDSGGSGGHSSSHTDVLDEICGRLQWNDPSVTMVNLNFVGIGNRGCIQLAEALRYNTNVVVLFLDGNDISNAGLQPLANVIATKPHLKMVYLSHNAIGNKGIATLARAFATSGCNRSRLEVLKLSNNGIGSSSGSSSSSSTTTTTTTGAGSVSVLSQLIQALPDTLHTLTLDGNCISDTELVSIAKDGLRTNTGIKSLDLRYNKNSSSSKGNDDRSTRIVRRRSSSSSSIGSNNSTLHSPASTPSSSDHKNNDYLDAFLTVLRDDNTTLSHLLVDDRNGNDSPCSLVRDEIHYYLRMNQLGRRSHGSTTIPKSVWPRVLAKAASGTEDTAVKPQRRRRRLLDDCAPNSSSSRNDAKERMLSGDGMLGGDIDVTYTLLLARPDLILADDL